MQTSTEPHDAWTPRRSTSWTPEAPMVGSDGRCLNWAGQWGAWGKPGRPCILVANRSIESSEEVVAMGSAPKDLAQELGGSRKA